MSVICKANLDALSLHLIAATDAVAAAYLREAAVYVALDTNAQDSVAGNAYSQRALFLDVLCQDIGASRDLVARMLTELPPLEPLPAAAVIMEVAA